jgi:heme exporter protein C
MSPRSNTARNAYWTVVVALLASASAIAWFWTPEEATMGPIQKVFYLHVPAGAAALLACVVVFVANIGYLWQRKMAWDDLSVAAARAAAWMCTIVLVTGMIWARGAWGRWWVWSPRLTFSLLLWLLYVVYLVIRPSIESRHSRATVSAVYGIVAFLDVPLVYLSVRLMPDIHPASVELSSAMKLTLALWFVPVTLLTAGLVVGGFRANVRRRTLERTSQPRSSWSADAAPAGGPVNVAQNGGKP